MTTVIAMWSGPRNLSTAMMRSFGARPDCAILDEPFFAPYLKVTGKEHPGRQETLAVHETDLSRIAEFCGASKTDKCYSFQIRQPARVIASYAKGRGGQEQKMGLGPLFGTPQCATQQDLDYRPPLFRLFLASLKRLKRSVSQITSTF